MDRDRLVVGLAAVFAGLTMLLVVAALAKQPFLLVLAVPFGATTYFLWYHASGRLEARTRARATETRGRTDPRSGGGARFDPDARFEGGTRGRFDGDPRSRFSGTRASDGRRIPRDRDPGGLTRASAYRTLGLDPDASETAIREAYRSKVKEVHPDTTTGDEERFKAVNRAYERLTE